MRQLVTPAVRFEPKHVATPLLLKASMLKRIHTNINSRYYEFGKFLVTIEKIHKYKPE